MLMRYSISIIQIFFVCACIRLCHSAIYTAHSLKGINKNAWFRNHYQWMRIILFSHLFFVLFSNLVKIRATSKWMEQCARTSECVESEIYLCGDSDRTTFKIEWVLSERNWKAANQNRWWTKNNVKMTRRQLSDLNDSFAVMSSSSYE